MSRQLGTIKHQWRSKIVILLLGITALFTVITLLFWRVFDPEIRGDLLAMIALIWFAIIGFAFWFMRYLGAILIKPILILGREVEAKRIIGNATIDQGIEASMIAPLARLVHEEIAPSAKNSDQQSHELARILQALDQAIMVVSPEHRLIFINNRTREILKGDNALVTGGAIDALFDLASIKAAIYRQEMQPNPAGERLFLATRSHAQLMPARLSLLRAQNDEIRGYLISIDFDAQLLLSLNGLERAYDGLMLEARAFAQIASIQARISDDATFAVEAAAHRAKLHDYRARGEKLSGITWPKTRIALRSLSALLAARVPSLAIVPTEKGVLLRCDPVAIIETLAQLVGDMENDGAKSVALDFQIFDDNVKFILRADEPVHIACVERSQNQILARLPHTPNGEEVLRAHGTEIWPHAEDDGTALVFILERVAQEALATEHGPERYDIDLGAHQEVAARDKIRTTGFVVFDTETTGLEPLKGDAIVQISAVRVFAGQVVMAETFDLFVNPGRTIPKSATAIHHIDDAQVADAPPIAEALRDFHRFVDGAPLIAHNAAFDMAFVRQSEASAGVKFDQTILDTVYLSAFLFDYTDAHTLDDLALRLDIEIPPELRHTGLGDAIATAQAFCKMIPLLEGRGVDRVDQLADIGHQMRAIRRKQARAYGR